MPKKKKEMKSDDLTILPLVDEEINTKNQLKKDLHPNLPDIKKGALMGIVASIRSGKTVLINNLFMRPEFFKDCFDTSFFISPTIYSDKSMRFIRDLYDNTCYDEYSDDIIYKICKYQESQPLEERGSYSIMADDCVDLKRNSALVFLASRFRHYSQKASFVGFSTQKFRSLSPIIRNNTTDWLIGGIKNKKERESIIEEMADAFGGEENFEEIWNYATSEPFCFLYLKMDRTPCEAYKNFNEKLYPREGGNPEEDDNEDDSVEETIEENIENE